VSAKPPQDRKISVSLPIDVIERFEALAASKRLSTAQYLRRLILEIDEGVIPTPLAAAVTASTAATAATAGATTGVLPTLPAAGTPALPHLGAKSGFKGVYPYGKRWCARVTVNGKAQRIGSYDTPEQAARAYDAYLVAQAGGDRNAAVNFPGPLDELEAAGVGFIEKFAAGQLTSDIDWATWQRATQGHAVPVPSADVLPVLPPGVDPTKVHASTPLVDRPAVTVYRRSGDPVLPPQRAPDYVPVTQRDPNFVPPPLRDPDARAADD
jgi:hypothetical protein